MKKYSHDNWNQVLALPNGSLKDGELRIIGSLAKGNLHWFVRRLMGRTDDIAYQRWNHQMAKRSTFLDYMERLNEEV